MIVLMPVVAITSTQFTRNSLGHTPREPFRGVGHNQPQGQLVFVQPLDVSTAHQSILQLHDPVAYEGLKLLARAHLGFRLNFLFQPVQDASQLFIASSNDHDGNVMKSWQARGTTTVICNRWL